MTMDDQSKREQLSAWMDGELPAAEQAQAWATLREPAAVQAWEVYHLIGDVLRSEDLARQPDVRFMAGLRERLAQESVPSAQLAPGGLAPVANAAEAANGAMFRWKMVAGLASVTAVAVLGWAVWTQTGGAGASGPALASAPAPATQATTVAVAEGPDGQQVMLRDPRLDELLAAHKQFGNTNTLQMPAGFLRNATFDSSGR